MGYGLAMKQKDHYKKTAQNQSFDLDAYIEEQSRLAGQQVKQEPDENDKSYRFKNFAIITCLFIVGFFWINDWNIPFQGSEETSTVATENPPAADLISPGIPVPPINIPPINIPPINIETNQAPALGITLTDYLTQLKEKGYLDGKINTFSARELYTANVPLSYLEELDEAELLEELNYFYITQYYAAGVTPEFLNHLKEVGLYEDLNFLDVIDLYQREGAASE